MTAGYCHQSGSYIAYITVHIQVYVYFLSKSHILLCAFAFSAKYAGIVIVNLFFC